ncbi:MAG: carbonic anhydrase [Pirellulales bacterium]
MSAPAKPWSRLGLLSERPTPPLEDRIIEVLPPAETREQALVFGDLAWEDFERLCRPPARHEPDTEQIQAGPGDARTRIADAQRPRALFITCSDSRVNPEVIMQAEPGELFIQRSAGGMVPPHGTAGGGEAATIEFALVGLGVREIVVCGHSDCRAIQALLADDSIRDSMPAVCAWLGHGEAARRIVRRKYAHLGGADLLNVAIQHNVLIQLEHLRTHPAVAAALARGDVTLHGWVYQLETRQVFVYDPQRGQFGLPTQRPSTTIPPLARPTAAQTI